MSKHQHHIDRAHELALGADDRLHENQTEAVEMAQLSSAHGLAALAMASAPEDPADDVLVNRLVEIAKEAILTAEPNGPPALTEDEEEKFDRRTRVAVMAILNYVHRGTR